MPDLPAPQSGVSVSTGATREGLWPPTWPMGCTMLRLLLLPVFLWLLLLDAGPEGEPHPHRWWAVTVFVVMAVTDKLDGYLARKLNQITRLGAILDPIADKLLIASAVVLLSSRCVAPEGYRIPTYVVIAVYGKDLLVVLGTLLMLYTVGRVHINARLPGKLSTALQLALVLLTLIAPDLTAAGFNHTRRLLDWIGLFVCVLAAAAFLDYCWVGYRQFRAARAAAPASR